MKWILLFQTVWQFISIVQSFRDYSANYTAPLSGGKLKYNKDCNCSIYENSFNNVLSRKRRGFVFFKGTLVVLTSVIAKALLVTSPKGLIQSSEVDLFYDVPLLVQGWRQPIDDFVKSMRVQNKKDDEAPKEDKELKNVGVVNVSSIPLDQYSKTAYNRPTFNQYPVRYNTNRTSLWYPNRRKFQTGYRRPYNRGSSTPYYPNSQRRNYVQTSSQNRNYVPNRSYQNSAAQHNRSHQSSSRNTEKQNNNETPSWHHHREYRERRDIYEHLNEFGKALGIQMRKCILRAICEMKQQMLPKGISFINDVARILFTVPTDHDNKEDEFTQMALEDNVDCARRFMISCPHSPLQYFVNNFRPTGMEQTSEPTAQDAMNSLIYA